MALTTHRHRFQTKRWMRRGSLVALLDSIVKFEPHSHLLVKNSKFRAQLAKWTVDVGRTIAITNERHSIADCIRIPNAHDALLSTKVVGSKHVRPILVTSDLSLKFLVFLGLFRCILRSRSSIVLPILVDPLHFFVDYALPINPALTLRFDSHLASRTDHSNHILGLDQAGHPIFVRPVLLSGQERAGPVNLPLPSERIAALECTGMVRLELELVVAPSAVLSHLLDGGIGLLGGEGRADPCLLFRRRKVVPDAHIDLIIRIVIVDKLQFGIIGIGIRVGRLFRLFVFVFLTVIVIGGSMKGREAGSATCSSGMVLVVATTTTNSHCGRRLSDERAGNVGASREAQEERRCRCR
mmetsp:Transcript_28131/g.81330  ORF Transcript_28131/g.81330 Transcript_28131/m.81330 type:complete len:354 (+) Transcript_28131:439-1500(+)